MNQEVLDGEITSSQQSYQPKWRPYIIWALIFVSSVVFRIAHWPGGFVMGILAISGVTAYSLATLLYYRPGIAYLRVIAIILGSISLLIILTSLLTGYPLSLQGIMIFVSAYVIWLVGYLLAFVVKKRNQTGADQPRRTFGGR